MQNRGDIVVQLTGQPAQAVAEALPEASHLAELVLRGLGHGCGDLLVGGSNSVVQNEDTTKSYWSGRCISWFHCEQLLMRWGKSRDTAIIASKKTVGAHTCENRPRRKHKGGQPIWAVES